MARTVRDAKLESRSARAALKAAPKPYFRAIDEGLHIGYRKGLTAGKWVMRSYRGEGAYAVELIGTADDTIDADGHAILTFAQAQGIARARFVEGRRVAAGLPAQSGPYTVRLCLEEYLTWLEDNRKSGRDARWRATALILPLIGDVPCARLTTKQLQGWRDAAAKAPARLRTPKGEAQRFREVDADADPGEARRKRRASVNRVLTILKAALNQAWREKRIASDDAWRALEPFEEADAARVRYLTVEEAKRLLNATTGDFRKLVQAALLTGARFGELAALAVGDFNPDSGTLHVRTSKSGKGRHVVLTEEGIAFFRVLAAGRGSPERMLQKAGAGRGRSHTRAGRCRTPAPRRESPRRPASTRSGTRMPALRS